MKKLLNKIFNPPLDILVFKIYIYWFLLGISIFIFFSNYISSIFASLVLLIFSSGFFILRYLRGDIKLPSKFAYLFPIFILISILSVFFSVDKYASILSLIIYISLFIIFILSFDILSKSKILQWFLSWLLFVGSIFSIIGLVYYFEGFSKYFVGTLNNAFVSSAFLLLLIPISIYFYIFSNKISLKIITLISSSLLVISLFLTFSYFGYIALLIELICIFFILREYWIKDLLKIFVLIIFIALLFIAIFNHHKPFNTFYNKSSNITSVLNISSNQRIALYKNEWNIFLKRPILGYGVGTVSDIFKKYEYSPWLYINHGYNFFIDIFLEVGIFGGLSFLIFFAFILYKGFSNIFSNSKYLKYQKKSPDNFIFIPIFISILGVIFYSFFNNDLSSIAILLPLFIFVGIIFNYFTTEYKVLNGVSRIMFILSILLVFVSFDMYLSGIFYNNGIKILDGNLNITKPQVNTALSYFNNSSLLFPFNYNTYNEKGISYEYLKEYSSAISNFKTSLSINTYNPNTNYELGKAYYFSSKYKKSLLYFKDAYNFNKLYSPEYDLSLGEYYTFRHQKNKAIKVYKESLKSFPLKNKLYEKYSQIFNNNGFNNNLSSIYSDLYSITKNKYYYNLYKKLSPLQIQIKNNSKVTTKVKVKTPVKK